jgi:hypothetical protein
VGRRLWGIAEIRMMRESPGGSSSVLRKAFCEASFMASALSTIRTFFCPSDGLSEMLSCALRIWSILISSLAFAASLLFRVASSCSSWLSGITTRTSGWVPEAVLRQEEQTPHPPAGPAA